ncbi:BQ5605_C005g03519 [Microbotryum silenes-dioicae]|uniref:BQ5605_C005g03519 protein n=1 Tax=Microbotryum silenes-dioicae TaxID=796604 RepID=A0A2X0MF30_9BASI|nr:BQ5605_C005g03519 [Microbotryum silenes-dioicae]
MARGTPSQVRLKFNQSLKGCSTAELQKRLRTLHNELAEIDQDLIVTSSLDKVAKELISSSLLLHKDRGSKAYLACCLADILRLYAPEAPYTQDELKFLFQQIKHVGDPSDAHQSQYFYLVDSLSNVKSIVLICDLDSGDELMAEIFKQCFNTITSNSPKNVEICVADILMQLLEEAQTLHADVIDIIVSQFLPKNVKARSAAHRLAVDVCTGAADKLQRYVCQYFAEVITSTISGANGANGDDSSQHDSDEEDDSDDDDDDDSDDSAVKRKKRRKQLQKKKKPATSNSNKLTSAMLDKVELPPRFVAAHELIESINRTVPQLLLNVVPLLEEELTADKPEYRRLATNTLGHMLGEPIGHGDVARKYPQTWKMWLQRSRDMAPAVRLAMIDHLKPIWTQHPELAQELGGMIGNVMLDADDRVRYAAVAVFETIEYEVALHHVDRTTLAALSERCRDRRPAIRALSFRCLGRLYDLSYTEIESRDANAVDQFGWIPGSLLELIKTGGDVPLQNSVRALIESTLLHYIVPQPKKEEDEQAWVDRFLLVLGALTQDQLATILSMTKLATRRPSAHDAFIAACERYNGGVIDKDEDEIRGRLKVIIQAIANLSGDPPKTAEDLQKFAKANEGQLYKLTKQLLDPQSDLKTMLKCQREYARRIEQINSSIVETFNWFIQSSAYLLINRSSIPTLLKRLRTRTGPDGQTTSNNAALVLEYISANRPVLYKAHVAELTKALFGETAKDDKLVEIALHALSRISKTERSVSIDKKLAERAAHFARSEKERQAKHAATIVALDTARLQAADDLVQDLSDLIGAAERESLVAHLSALARVVRHAVGAFETKSEDVTSLALEILNRKIVPGEVHDDLNWVEDDQLDPLAKARLLVVKLFTNRCLAYADTDSAEQFAQPVFKMLWPLLQVYDEDTSKYTPSTASRLRLAAAHSMLKLATCTAYSGSIARSFELLARTAQDECYEVRSGFINKLLTYLRSNRISTTAARYNMVLFLTAHDPEVELRLSVQNFVKTRANAIPPAARQAQFEHPFVRLLHLLAHHPDFEGEEHDEGEIATMAKYIEFYLECLATKENAPYLFHLALKVKTMRDAHSDAYNTNLYLLSELAQHLIKNVAKSYGWPLPTFPHGVTMPSDIFKLMPDKATQKKVMDTVYLTDDLLASVRPTIKIRSVLPAATVPKKRRSPKPKASPKLKALSTTGGKKAKKPKRDSFDSSAEEESDEEVGSSDEEAELDVDGQRKNKRVKSPPKARPAYERKGLRSTNGVKKSEDEDEEMEEQPEEVEEKVENKSPLRDGKGKKAMTPKKKGADSAAPTSARAKRTRGSKVEVEVEAEVKNKPGATRASRRRKAVDSDSDEMDED